MKYYNVIKSKTRKPAYKVKLLKGTMDLEQLNPNLKKWWLAGVDGSSRGSLGWTMGLLYESCSQELPATDQCGGWAAKDVAIWKSLGRGGQTESRRRFLVHGGGQRAGWVGRRCWGSERRSPWAQLQWQTRQRATWMRKPGGGFAFSGHSIPKKSCHRIFLFFLWRNLPSLHIPVPKFIHAVVWSSTFHFMTN